MDSESAAAPPAANGMSVPEAATPSVVPEVEVYAALLALLLLTDAQQWPEVRTTLSFW